MKESWNSFHAIIMMDYSISNNIVVILQSVMNFSLVLINVGRHERFRSGFLVFNFNQRKHC